jgi:short-subunit dehydrogenase
MKSNQAKNKDMYALVTGGTSGIGYELAKKLAGDGYNLIIVARDQEQLKTVEEDLGQFGTLIKTLSIDLFEEDAAKRIYDATREMGINVDILINDAGQGEWGMFVDTNLERQLDIIRLNVNSLVSLTYYFMKDMVERDQGRILQLGSEVSKSPTPLMAVYAATKAFVLSFTEALINELEDTNVSMTLLMPGATDTDFFDKAGAENTKVYRESKLDSPADVAADAYEALMKGERRIIGSRGKMNVAMANVTPDNVNASKLRKSMEPSQKDDDEVRHEPAHKQSRLEKQRQARK